MSKDRRDGKFIEPSDPIQGIVPFLMKNRTEAEVYMEEQFDVTNLLNYLEHKNKDLDNYKITIFHAFVTAIAKTIYNRPKLNNFIAGKRLYRRNDITISFVAKNKFSDISEDKLLLFKVKDDMTINDVSSKIYKDVQKVRKGGSNSIDDTLRFVTKFPRFMVSLIMYVFRKLDYYDLVPKSITESDPNYSTVLVSNLGSIKSNPCYHHLNNYGTNSIVITIGEIRQVNELNKEGIAVTKDIVKVGITLDERIGNGFYFAKSFLLIKHIIENPELLEEELIKVVNHEEK